jgi:hypothetical protein
VWESAKTRDGKIYLAELALLCVTLVAIIGFFIDFVQTGSPKTLLASVLLAFLSFWPALRRGLSHGDWS